jgi:hypothetical protein
MSEARTYDLAVTDARTLALAERLQVDQFNRREVMQPTGRTMIALTSDDGEVTVLLPVPHGETVFLGQRFRMTLERR